MIVYLRIGKGGEFVFNYTVKSGESLFSIAAKYQVPLDTVRNANGLTDSTLVPGQALLIPTDVYIVQPGDSLFMISQMSTLPVQALRAANGLTSDRLSVGMRLYLPPRTK